MFKIFDYIFYRVSDFYISRWKDAQGMVYGIGVVSIMQLTHMLFILLIFAFFSNSINEIIFELREDNNFMHSGVIYPCLIVLAFNFFRYFKILPYEKAKKQWGGEEAGLQRKKSWWIISYIIFNLGITIFLSVFRKYYL
jgi:hypothetical protein